MKNMLMKRCYLFLLTFLISYYSFSQHRSEISNYVAHVQLNGDKLLYCDTIQIQINERIGDHDARGRLIYQKGEKASFGDIWIEDLLGNRIRKLKKNEIKEYSYINNFSLYQDGMVKSFEAKHHQYPYQINYTQRQETKRFIDLVRLDYYGQRVPVNSGELILEHPIDRHVKQWVKKIDTYKADTVDQTVYHRYYYSLKPNLYIETYASVNTGDVPQIIISPLEFKYGIAGRNDNWETLGNWFYKLNKGRDLLPVEEKERIDGLIGDEKDKYKQVEILYKYLQENTRYVNISTRIGGLQTYPAEYVVENGYGDCKALTNYMQSMLKYIGIESFYTLIYSDSKVYDLHDDFSYNAFNHVILVVPISKDTLFLECTSNTTPLGYIGTSNQGRRALLVKENGSKLIWTPKMSEEDVLCVRDLDLKISNGRDASLVLKARERGEDYELLNAYTVNTSRNVLENFIRENILLGTFDMTNYQIKRESRNSAYIDLEVNYNMSNVCKKYGNNLVVNSFPMSIPRFEDADRRTQDLQIDYPIYKKDRFKIFVDGFTISKIPSHISISSPYGDCYEVNYKREGDCIIIDKKLLITPKRLSVEQYKDFYSFISRVKNNEISNFYFEVL